MLRENFFIILQSLIERYFLCSLQKLTNFLTFNSEGAF